MEKLIHIDGYECSFCQSCVNWCKQNFFPSSFLVSPFDVAKHLRMAQEFAEVNVEHVATALQHDVVIVAVTDTQDVGGHAAACTGVDEVLYCLQKK